MLRLKELRNKGNISQQKLASMLGVSRSTIAMWETKSSQPDNEMLIKLSEIFGVSVDYLLGKDISAPLLDRDGLSERDRKDIAKDMESIREKLINKTDGPASFNGENIDDDDAELLLDAIEMMLKRVKKINKVKYNPNKNKSEG